MHIHNSSCLLNKMFKHFSSRRKLHFSLIKLYSVRSHGENVKIKKGSAVDRTMDFEDIRGPRSYPVIGTLYKYLPFIGDYNAESLDKNAWLNWRRYGSLVREVPGVRLLHVFDPDDIEAVFRQDDRYPARRSHVAMYHYRINKPHVYNTGGLLSTNGPDWWRLRSTFQKNFTSPQSVKGYIENTDTVSKEFVQWIKEINISQDEDFLPYLNRLNLEVIGTVAFNERFNSFSLSEQDTDSRSSRVIAAAFGSNSGIMKLDKGFLWKMFKTPLYKKLASSQEYLEKVSVDILLRKVHFFETEVNDAERSLLDLFLQQPNLDLKDITGMMVDILMAAIDTVPERTSFLSSKPATFLVVRKKIGSYLIPIQNELVQTAFSTSFALYHISRNPKVQAVLFEEVSSLLPTKDCSITSEVLAKAAYVRSCIKESLRLNPVSIGVGRLLQKDIVLGGYLIPKGTVIVTQNMIASRLPQYVQDPLQFKPERWLRNSSHYENIHPFLSLPFGFGPRSCIARRLAEQNISVILMRLIREFKIEWKGEELGVSTHLINKPDKPVSLSFVTRKN